MAPPSPQREKLKVSNNLKEQLTAELEKIIVKAVAASVALEKLIAKKEQLTAAIDMIPTANTPPIVPVLAVLARGKKQRRLRQVSDEPEEDIMPSLPPPLAIQPSTAVFEPIYDSNSDEFELGPEADTVLLEIESEAAIKSSVKSSVRVDEQKRASQPFSTGVVVELADKEKRAMNKKIRDEVLQNIPQFKAVLGVPQAFGMEHWKELFSKMENGGDYTKQLFFGQSRVSQGWRKKNLAKARAKLKIGIIRPKVGGRALGETTAMAARSAIEVAKRATSTHTLCISDDVAANDGAVGQVVLTLEAFRGSVTPINSSSLTSYFAVGNQSKAQNHVIRDYDSAMKIMAK